MTTEKQKERKKTQQKRFYSNLLWFCKRHQRDWLIFFHLSILLSTKIIYGRLTIGTGTGRNHPV